MNPNSSPLLDLTQIWGPLTSEGSIEPLSSLELQEDIEESSLEVLWANGVQARRDSRIGGLTTASVIGFSGHGLTGALGVATSDEVLAGLYRQCLSMAGEARQHGDWLREVSNQVLGRFKGRMLGRGYAIYLALPQSVRGMCLVPNEHRHNHIAWTVLATEHGPLLTWLDLERVDGQVLEAGPPVQARASGEMVLF